MLRNCPLESGKPIQRELAAGQKHEYQVASIQNQCLEITIVARDIELTLSVTNPTAIIDEI